ncbi:hypothetical protein HY837_04320 [archaeon]|nr:hypothetical protein [archaeon]
MSLIKRLTIGTFAGLAALTFMSSGCAKTRNKWAQQGGVLGSYTADYIVIRQNGGEIMDVWKLNDVMVQSEEHSDGWLFRDQNGNAVNVGGDAKIVRINSTNSELWNKYQEYHSEFETKTYREKFNSK